MKSLVIRVGIGTVCTTFIVCIWMYKDVITAQRRNREMLVASGKTSIENTRTNSNAADTDTATSKNFSMSTISYNNLSRPISSTRVFINTSTTTTGVIVSSSKRNVFYNRVGKCGSRTLFNIAATLSKFNNFTVKFSNEYDNESPSPLYARVEMVKISRLKPPTFYNRHIYYMDFKKYGFQQPIYINMIRDPIDRFSSHYNYMKYGDARGKVAAPRADWQNISTCVMNDISPCRDTDKMFYIGSYFCGLDDICKEPSRERVELAKKHIDEEYLVVGMLEDFENTLKLLSKMLPEYFRGALSVWKRHEKDWSKSTKTTRKDFLTKEAKEKLRNDNLADEYEVYEHAMKKYERLKQEYGIS